MLRPYEAFLKKKWSQKEGDVRAERSWQSLFPT
jgi:hypothetical protein